MKAALGCLIPLIVVPALAAWGVRYYLRPKPKVEPTEIVQRGDVSIKVVETGAIEALRKVDVKSKVGGRVSALFTDEGMKVHQGQVVATIDPQEIDTEVAALRSQLAAARARLAAAREGADYQKLQTNSGIDQYQHNVEAARAHLSQTLSDANAQPALTAQAINIAQANLNAAKATFEAQQASLKLLIQSTHPEAVVAAQSAFDQAQAQTENDKMAESRERQLFKDGFVAAQDVDAATTQTRVSEAHLREMKERLDRMTQTVTLEEANARAQTLSAQSQVDQMEAALAQAKSSVLPVTTREAVQSARAAYQQAQAQLAGAEAGRTQDQMQVDQAAAAAADMAQIQNQLNEKLVNQQDTTILASMSGTIIKRDVERGELITSAIGSFSDGTTLFQIADLSTMLVRMNVNEVDIAKIQPGMTTEVTIDAAKGATFAGRVRRVAPAAVVGAAGAGSSGSRGVVRFEVEIQIDRADSRLKPGMSARCAIIVARKRNVLRVPSDCLYGAGAHSKVHLVTDTLKNGQKVETIRVQPVTVGLRGDDYVEILSGVKLGEKLRPVPYSGPPRKTIDLKAGG
ncbi:MAG TPA: efflux RND transporter periplasmic adaptor subunit [Armatimonadota bacterium]|nr:efflux RND transporter periplasmic adaptor subunit [Armatimonadota bacterium]